VDVEAVANEISKTHKPVEVLGIQENGGSANTIAKGSLLAQEMAIEASLLERVPCKIGDLVLGLKCGSSDTTSGLSANPALGVASDLLVRAGGTSILGEVTEFIGAEHLLARRSQDARIRGRILELVTRMESRAKSTGVDIRGGQPTRGNIQGGLTTIEEKSLGAIAKAGTAMIQDVYEYGCAPTVKGLVVMDSPGREPELLTGLAAAGCTIVAFTTGRGAPQGFPFVPVVKITGNSHTWENLRDHVDLDVSPVMDGRETLVEAGERIYRELLGVASGRLTAAEVSGYMQSMDIYTLGPVL
jgi:altronate dehydratase large subunit